MTTPIKKVDFGIADGKSFFEQVVLPNVQVFESAPTVQSGLNAAWALWHLHEWYCYDIYPEGCCREKKKKLRKQLCQDCPELEYLHDITDAAKHRGTNRSSLSVKRFSHLVGRGGAGGYNAPSGGYGVGQQAYGSGTPQLRVFFDGDSDPRWLGYIIEAAKDYWSRTLYMSST